MSCCTPSCNSTVVAFTSTGMAVYYILRSNIHSITVMNSAPGAMEKDIIPSSITAKVSFPRIIEIEIRDTDRSRVARLKRKTCHSQKSSTEPFLSRSCSRSTMGSVDCFTQPHITIAFPRTPLPHLQSLRQRQA
jgi:hypothetical protein